MMLVTDRGSYFPRAANSDPVGYNDSELDSDMNSGSTAVATRESSSSQDSGEWPAEVDLILSALEAGRGLSTGNRRGASRTQQRMRASLRLFSDLPDTDPWTLYTRDVNARGIGFITRHRLPLGYGGMVRVTLPDGTDLEAHCTLLRCREAATGWYEGALYFNRPQKPAQL